MSNYSSWTEESYVAVCYDRVWLPFSSCTAAFWEERVNAPSVHLQATWWHCELTKVTPHGWNSTSTCLIYESCQVNHVVFHSRYIFFNFTCFLQVLQVGYKHLTLCEVVENGRKGLSRVGDHLDSATAHILRKRQKEFVYALNNHNSSVMWVAATGLLCGC